MPLSHAGRQRQVLDLGLFGPAIKPIALRFIAQMKQHPELKNVPISGIGGIVTWQDVLEFLLVGSGTIQVTTARHGIRLPDRRGHGQRPVAFHGRKRH